MAKAGRGKAHYWPDRGLGNSTVACGAIDLLDYDVIINPYNSADAVDCALCRRSLTFRDQHPS